MSATAPVTIVPEQDYLDAERDSDVRHEFVEGALFAMVGASRAHNTITSNLVAALHRHVSGKGCRVAASDMKVRLAGGTRYYYPDVLVSCSQLQDEPDDYVETQPVLIAEVLSSGTEPTDRREKRIAYQSLPSLIDYLLVSQNSRTVELFRREGSGWTHTLFNDADTIDLHSIDAHVSMRDVYTGVPLAD